MVWDHIPTIKTKQIINQIVSLKCIIDLNTILYIMAIVENMATSLSSVMYEKSLHLKPNQAYGYKSGHAFSFIHKKRMG